MRLDVPDGWEVKTLGAICSKPQYGWTSRAASSGTVKFVRTTDISHGSIDWASVPYCEKVPPDLARFRIAPNDILVSRAGSVGVSIRVEEVPCDAVFASYLIRFRPHEGIVPEFIEFFLKSSSYWRSISDLTSGIAVGNVNASKLASLEVPLPPLPQQRQLVDVLATMNVRAKSIRQHLSRARTTLAQFRQSVLAAASSGRLTGDWRKEHGASEEDPGDSFPQSWNSITVEEVVEDLRYGTASRSTRDTLGIPVLRIPNIGDGAIDQGDLKYAHLVESEMQKLRLIPGDVLLIRSNGSASLVGRSAIVRAAEDGFAFAGYLIRLRPVPTKIEPEFLNLVLRSPQVRQQIDRLVRSTSGVHNINGKEVRGLEFALPPRDEQREIVARATSLLDLSHRVGAALISAGSRFESLNPAFSAKAFRGELVVSRDETTVR